MISLRTKFKWMEGSSEIFAVVVKLKIYQKKKERRQIDNEFQWKLLFISWHYPSLRITCTCFRSFMSVPRKHWFWIFNASDRRKKSESKILHQISRENRKNLQQNLKSVFKSHSTQNTLQILELSKQNCKA